MHPESEESLGAPDERLVAVPGQILGLAGFGGEAGLADVEQFHPVADLSIERVAALMSSICLFRDSRVLAWASIILCRCSMIRWNSSNRSASALMPGLGDKARKASNAAGG